MKIKLFSSLIFFFLFTIFLNAAVYNSPRTFQLPSAQIAVAAGDLDRDGFPDLISGGYPGTPFIGKIYVSLGKGNGNFHPPQSYRVGVNPNDIFDGRYIEKIMVWDMNNDGNLDVIVSHNGERNFTNNSDTFITILMGNGQGDFVSIVSYNFFGYLDHEYTTSFDLVDTNHDGLMDVILATNSGSTLSSIFLLRNLGNGNFQTYLPKLIFGQMFDVAAGNFNNDAFPDLVMTTTEGIFIGFGGAEIYPLDYINLEKSIFFRVSIAADFNGDGKTDFAASPIQSSQLHIFINGENGIPENPVIYQTTNPVELLKAADLNSDNKVDLFYASGAKINILYGNGDGTFNAEESIILNSSAVNLTTADFDKDGKIDFGAVPGSRAGVILNSPNTSRYYTDFDGDRKSDFTVYRPNTGTWWTLFSDNSFKATQFGLETDKIVSGNYDGDNKTEIAVYRNGVWYILQSSDNSVKIEHWGLSGDIPVPADYDNDGKMNLAVYRPSEGVWYIKNENGFNSIKWGISTDKPVPADYDGDGKTDIAVFRPENGTWYILNSKNGTITFQPFGVAEDKPVPSDYDGDGKADFAVYRNGTWYLLQSSLGFTAFQFGLGTDIPVPADYDGDSKTDAAVYRNGMWYLLQSTKGFQKIQFGLASDKPNPIFYKQ